MLDEQLKFPCVAILMGTFNGAAFLREQLDSFSAQTHHHWRLMVSDDGSSDGTLALLADYQKLWGSERLQIRSGPHRGFCRNFLSLANDPSIQADYYAFSDQDDVWLPAKLEQALRWLEACPSGTPAVYCGRTQYVDQNMTTMGLSPAFVRPMTFRNALMQSVAGANTMVFNQAAKSLFERCGEIEVVSHDWWTYLLVTGAGGQVFFDQVPQVLYRQHQGSLVGENVSILSKFKRASMLFNGVFRRYIELNLSALHENHTLLQPVNDELLTVFSKLRQANWMCRLPLLWKCRVYRQFWLESLIMGFAALIKRI